MAKQDNLNHPVNMMQGGGYDFWEVYRARHADEKLPRRELMPRDIMLLARLEAAKSLKTLADVRDDQTTPAQVKVVAANSILDRAYGKPVQGIAITEVPAAPQMDLSALSDTELLALEKLLNKAGTSLTGDQPSETIDGTATTVEDEG